MDYIYLSRRNLLTLLSKLDRAKAGERTFCAIIKADNQHPDFSQTIDQVMVTAVEDEVYYTDREAGDVHPSDNSGRT